MRGHTHIAGGLALATLSLTMLEHQTNIGFTKENMIILSVYGSAAVLGSLLPDIDIKGSKISNKNKIASFIIRTFFGHRGFTHSMLCYALLSMGVFFLSGMIPGGYGGYITKGFMIGYLSHLILDMLNPMGVPLLFPNKKMVSIAGIKTGGFLENFVFLGLCAGVLAAARGMFG